MAFRLGVLFTALTLALAAPGLETGSAQVTVTIQGTVANGTGGAEPPPDLQVFGFSISAWSTPAHRL